LKTSPKQLIKDAKAFVYGRVSTVKQEGTLDTQKDVIKDALKNLGYTRNFEYYAEQGSGGGAITKKGGLNRPKLNQLILDAVKFKKEKKKPVVVVLRDIQRFTRDPYDLGILYKNTPSLEESLWFNNIPLLALNDNQISGTKETPDDSGDLVIPILISAGGSELSIRKQQSKGGQKRKREEGIISGTPRDLYFKDKLNPIREASRLFKLGMTQAEVGRRVGRSRSWAKDTRNFLKLILERGGTKLLNEWLDVTDLIRAMEQKHGTRIGRYALKPMIAVSRKTSGYLKSPWEFSTPTQKDLDFYYENYKDFQPRK
jgi:DNA invertase Pin-like site-specific DNA recombinase